MSEVERVRAVTERLFEASYVCADGVIMDPHIVVRVFVPTAKAASGATVYGRTVVMMLPVVRITQWGEAGVEAHLRGAASRAGLPLSA